MITSTLVNCYEVKERTGKSGITENTTDSLKEVNQTLLTTENFYKNTLHFDETVWDFSQVSKNGYPTLKH